MSVKTGVKKIANYTDARDPLFKKCTTAKSLFEGKKERKTLCTLEDNHVRLPCLFPPLQILFLSPSRPPICRFYLLSSRNSKKKKLHYELGKGIGKRSKAGKEKDSLFPPICYFLPICLASNKEKNMSYICLSIDFVPYKEKSASGNFFARTVDEHLRS